MSERSKGNAEQVEEEKKLSQNKRAKCMQHCNAQMTGLAIKLQFQCGLI